MVKLSMIYKLFVIFSFLAIFASGISRDTVILSVLLSLSAICFGLIHVLKNKQTLNFPRYFTGMLLFVIILQIYPIFMSTRLNPFYFAAIFGVGLIYWLIFFNIKHGGAVVQSLLVKLTLLYSLFYVLTKFFNMNLVKTAGLFFLEGMPSRHYHMGDLWAFTLISIIGMGWGAFKLKDWLLMDLGFLFLVVSNARSAYLSLLLGFVYLLTKKWKGGNSHKFIPVAFVSLIIGLFIFASSTKTTLFSRPYFLQSIESFPEFPLGVGMGNFNLIAEHLLQNSDLKNLALSSYTHNIFLETLSGVGIFSILFLIFLVKIAIDILQEHSKKVVWGALLMSILINFMFDTTYTIPGLIWILFMALGVFQSKKDLLKGT